jgi:hypothetical protein
MAKKERVVETDASASADDGERVSAPSRFGRGLFAMVAVVVIAMLVAWITNVSHTLSSIEARVRGLAKRLLHSRDDGGGDEDTDEDIGAVTTAEGSTPTADEVDGANASKVDMDATALPNIVLGILGADPAGGDASPTIEEVHDGVELDEEEAEKQEEGPTVEGPTVEGPTVEGPTVEGPTVEGVTVTDATERPTVSDAAAPAEAPPGRAPRSKGARASFAPVEVPLLPPNALNAMMADFHPKPERVRRMRGSRQQD